MGCYKINITVIDHQSAKVGTMNKLFFKFLALTAVVVCQSAPTGDFVTDSGRFSLDLYSAVAKKTSDNVVVSPVSVQAALGLLYLGADGSTASKMSQALHFDADQHLFASKFHSLLDEHDDSESVQIANKIFVNEGVQVKPEFNKLASEKLNSEAETLDMSNGPQAAKVINDWMELKTNSKIKDIVDAGGVQGAPSVIVNAVYFKADWMRPFAKHKTAEEDFWVSATESKKIDMMKQVYEFPYGEFDDFKAVRLSYRFSDFSFVVVLPKERDGLKALEARFAEPSANLKTLLDNLQDAEVDLQLPKFKIETELNLDTALTTMGLGSIFSPEANFSKLTSESLRLGKVVHKAIIDVDEVGTEAAASIALFFVNAVIPYESRKEFIADHPFLYFLVDSQGHIFFMGRYVK